MIAQNRMKMNGKWYKAGEEISLAEPQEEVFEPQEEEPDEPKIEEDKIQYTKTDINRMSTAELQTLATENGIDGADGMTGADLKKVLIEKFGLQIEMACKKGTAKSGSTKKSSGKKKGGCKKQ